MIIKEIKFTEVIIPGKPGTINSPALHKPLHKLSVGGSAGWSKQFDEMEKMIIELKLDNGVVGYGEFYRAQDNNVVDNIAKLLVGRSLDDFPLQNIPINYCREYDGFECAIWDAFAKSKSMRLVDLLGGQVNEKVKVGAWTGHRLVEEIGEMAKNFQAQGYETFKFKCDLEDDIPMWCQTIKDVAPGLQVILDPNERWGNLANTKRVVAPLEEVGNVYCLEDPMPRWQLQDYAILRSMTKIPIFLHVSLPYVVMAQRQYDAINAIAHQAIDGFNFNGGLAKFKELDAIASVAGMTCWHGSELDLGILEAMYVHQVAAAASCTDPSDIFGRLVREHDLLKQPIRIEGGYAYLPDNGYGLGIELDYDAIKHYQTDQRTITATS